MPQSWRSQSRIKIRNLTLQIILVGRICGGRTHNADIPRLDGSQALMREEVFSPGNELEFDVSHGAIET